LVANGARSRRVAATERAEVGSGGKMEMDFDDVRRRGEGVAHTWVAGDQSEP
jgi:hypothetical protein